MPLNPTTVTIHQICDALETTLGAATGIAVHETFDELTEGVHDRKLLQVYPESGVTDSATRNDRTTFRRGVAQTEMIFHADVYAQQRVNIGEDMAALVPLIDAIILTLEAQDVKNLFGLAGIQSFSWRWERVIFEYSNIKYMGARFYITIKVF